MGTLRFNNKEVNLQTATVEGIYGYDYPDFVDAFISYLEFEDGTPFNDNELIEFCEENYSITNELIHENNLYL
jgi:hypothetical protein